MDDEKKRSKNQESWGCGQGWRNTKEGMEDAVNHVGNSGEKIGISASDSAMKTA